MATPLSSFFEKYDKLRIPKGEIFLYSQNKPKGVYYLKKGSVRYYIISPDGKELTIHIYNPGSFFPLFWAINNQIPDYNLQALTNCVIYAAPKKEFLEWIAKEPEILLDLNKRLLHGLSGLSKRIEIISLENAQSRVRSILLYLSEHFENKHFTHEEIAALTGLTRERVSIEMKNLKEAGFINYSRKNLTILQKK